MSQEIGLELPKLILGSDAVKYYRILEYTFLSLVKDDGLQPCSDTISLSDTKQLPNEILPGSELCSLISPLGR